MLTVPRPQADSARHLSPQTLAWLADRPHARQMVHSMWDTLAELEQAGHHPGAISALRWVLLNHQPHTRAGRCRACRRSSWHRLWRRRPFPCRVWITIHIELQGLFSGNRSHTPVSLRRRWTQV